MYMQTNMQSCTGYSIYQYRKTDKSGKSGSKAKTMQQQSYVMYHILPKSHGFVNAFPAEPVQTLHNCSSLPDNA